MIQRIALDVLHDDIGLIGLDLRVVDLDDVRMIKTPADRSFDLEQFAQTTGHDGVILAKPDQLDGDFQPAVRIARQVDDRRRALSQCANDLVLTYLFHAVSVIHPGFVLNSRQLPPTHSAL